MALGAAGSTLSAQLLTCCGGGLVIPDLIDGQLPVGRYVATLDEIYERFVMDDEFSGSTTRADLWDGFERYLATWKAAEEALETPGLLHRLCLGGSFVSSKPDPEDVDVAVYVDDLQREHVKGRRGAGILDDLVGHRAHVRGLFGVEPFSVPWRPVTSILDLDRLSGEERDYLLRRGAMEDLWERRRPPGPKAALRAEDAPAARGSLEVIFL